jgi:glyoxylase-like metal-dependent hydrolase (beta-lactamase superfamily II)
VPRGAAGGTDAGYRAGAGHWPTPSQTGRTVLHGCQAAQPAARLLRSRPRAVDLSAPELGLNVNRRAGPKHWLRCPVLSYVIEHPDGLLLWDTGISPEWPSEWLDAWQILIDLSEITPEVCLLSRLKADGLGPEDFRYVVQSHLHADHAGGLRIFQSAGAEIIVQEAEYRHVESLREPQRFWVPADFDLLHEVKPPTLVAGDEELMRGVRLIHLPGHSPGSMALLVELDHTGWVALTGDAFTPMRVTARRRSAAQ